MGGRELIWGAAWRLMLTGALVYALLVALAYGLPHAAAIACAVALLLLWQRLMRLEPRTDE